MDGMNIRGNAKVHSLYTWFMAGAMFFLFAFGWYAANTFVQAFIEAQIAQYGGYYDTTTNTFLTNVWTYMAVLVSIAILIAVIVQSQKERAEVVYYR